MFSDSTHDNQQGTDHVLEQPASLLSISLTTDLNNSDQCLIHCSVPIHCMGCATIRF